MDQYEYLKRQYYLATHMELTEENVIGAYELVEISYKILAENLEIEMQNAFIPFLSAYKEVNGKVKDIDLSKLKEKLQLTYIFITHDLAVVRNISNKTIVMNKGRIVEMNNTQKIFESPKEEYTKELIRSIPTITEEEEKIKP